MKKLMTLMMALVPFGMMAQSSQVSYASADDIFNSSYADLGSVAIEEAADDDFFKVNDLLLADPDFDVQENMIAYTKDQKTVYFSANRKLKETKAEAKIKKSVQLQLFKAEVAESGDWVNLEMMNFNGNKHSTGYPALNEDDSVLYFVSDGPLSTGKTDILAVDLFEDGTYSEPKNLGNKINSLEREILPVVDDSNVLYFASDVESEGEELNVFASKVIDNEPMAPVMLDVDASGSKEAYIAAFREVDAETIRLAEEAANLRDLEILLEAETIAEIERIEEALGDDLVGGAYDFDSSNVVYTVQIGAFVQKVKTGTYDKSSGLFNYRYDDGYNRFYSGVFSTVEEANAHMMQMKNDGYRDAFVLGLDGKKRFLPE
ncbi:MAG: SPOR domain-containing protein [Lutimonas sp.]